MELTLKQIKGPKLTKRKQGMVTRNNEGEEPGWADGLRKLYQSVAEEPLPSAFDDLLKRLDEAHDG